MLVKIFYLNEKGVQPWKLWNTNLEKISLHPQLILLYLKPDGNGTFVDFLIIINPSYTETRLKQVNNNLGIDQKNSGLNLVPSFMKGNGLLKFCHDFKILLIKAVEQKFQ